MSSTETHPPKVLILGAGLGGLSLAQSLRKKGVPFEIFERDESVDSRFAGWSIALHSMLDDFASSIPDDMPSIQTTSHLLPLELPPQICFFMGPKRFGVQSTDELKIVRANRLKLRQWLTTNIDVQWNKRVTQIEGDDKSVKLVFSDGSSATGDVLVGAEGVNSIVRKHLLGKEDVLHIVPTGVITGELTLNKEQYERQLKLANSAYIVVGRYIVFVGLNSVSADASSAEYYWYLTWNDATRTEGKDYWTASASKQEMYDFTIEQTKALDPKFTEIFRLTPVDRIQAPPFTIRDMVLETLPNGRVTLLGDAAHPMTPFRGEGGCHAIKDALSLARTLAKAEPASVRESLKEYQDEMLARGSSAVKLSRAVFEAGKGGPRHTWGQDIKEMN